METAQPRRALDGAVLTALIPDPDASRGGDLVRGRRLAAICNQDHLNEIITDVRRSQGQAA